MIARRFRPVWGAGRLAPAARARSARGHRYSTGPSSATVRVDDLDGVRTCPKSLRAARPKFAPHPATPIGVVSRSSNRTKELAA